MKRFLLLVVSAWVALSLQAVPAESVPFVVTQPDGSVLTLTMVGDEFLHYFVTPDGEAMRYDEVSGFYVPYCDGQLASLHDKSLLRKRHINRKRVSRQAVRRVRALPSDNAFSPFTGSKKGLVILVNFSDVPMTCPQSEIFDQFNLEGYNKYGHIGSVHDYFSAQSYGQFDLTFDVVGPVTLSRDLAYYGRNDSEDNDSLTYEMIVEACQLVDDEVDFPAYDWDGDGEVDQVFVLYAGYGENVSVAHPELTWPHEYSLSEWQEEYGRGPGAILLDGVKIDTYAVSCELRGTSGSILNGIGTACHEFSHCLGYPDFYDIDYSGGFGMSYWDLMAAGSYNGPNNKGEAYERWMAGWLNPVELKAACTVTLPCLADSAAAYILYHENSSDEYYLFENRQNRQWFSYPYQAHGMLITHVDFNDSIWKENTPNDDPDHQRMTFFPADNVLKSTTTSLQGDLYPGPGNNTSLTDSSLPVASWYHAASDGSNLSKHSITDISESDGIITFRFDGGGASITAVEIRGNKDSVIYDLLGRRVSGESKGLRVSQGRLQMKK